MAECLPITPAILAKQKEAWTRKGARVNGCMLWEAAFMCFFGFMQSEKTTIPSANAFTEGAYLTFSNLALNSTSNLSILHIHLKASKTDTFRMEIDIYVGKIG